MYENTKKKVNRLRARSIARGLLKECSIDNPPIKLSLVLKHLDISISKTDTRISLFKKISAFIDLEDRLLFYKPDDPVVRQRFSVAHELGHYLMKHSIGRDIFNINSKDPREIEANVFAAEFLIPFDWIKTDLMNPKSNIKNLARKYWVSELAIGWRISNSDVLTLK